VENTIQNIARGVCIKDEFILLAYHKEDKYHFLPGGHVEFGESLSAALKREFFEELGITIDCHGLVTIFEHGWDKKGVLQHEINFYFSIELTDFSNIIESQVDHLSFEWLPIAKLTEIKFLPSEVLETITNFNKGESSPCFISTLEK